MWNAASRQFFLNQAKPYPYATGGDYVYLYEDTNTGKTYRVHEFLSTGTSTLNVEVGGQMDILVVGGGGGGGQRFFGGGGGGGAGGVVALNSFSVPKESCSVIVGKGGTAAVYGGDGARKGENSSITINSTTYTAEGGGLGGGYGTTSVAGGTGGCGGGGAWLLSGGSGTTGQGKNGGSGNGFVSGYSDCARAGGGGGGAGETGSSAVTPSSNVCVTAGKGGDGIQWLNGKYYGGGGGGGVGAAGSGAAGGSGGLGGGGGGGNVADGNSGSPNTGGGGGGGINNGGNGGSGIVIVRYVIAEKKLWTPSELSDIHSWYKADSISLNDGDPVSTWSDSSGGGYDITQTSTSRPTYKTSTLNGLPVVEFDGTDDYLAASTAADWKFLHDSTGSSIFVVAKPGTAADPNAAYGLLGTHGGVTTDTGINLLYDDRSSLSRNDRLASLVNNGSGSFFVLNLSADDVLDANTYAIASVVADPANATLSDRSSIYVNGGTAIKNNSNSGTASSSNPSYALHVGSQGGGNSKMSGGIAEIVICDAVLSDTDRQKLEGYLAHKWGLTNNLPSGHPYKYEPPYKVEPEEIVTDGLVLNLDAGDYASYPRSGTTWYDISGNGNNSTLNGTYTFDIDEGSIEFSNSSSAPASNVSFIKTASISNMRTFSFWFYRNAISGSFWRYLLDGRPSVNNSWIISGGIGSFWTGSLLYVNGISQTFSWANIEPSSLNEWRNVTIISPSSLSTALYIFSRYTGDEGFSGTLGKVLIYNRALSSTEITQNFNALRGRYGV